MSTPKEIPDTWQDNRIENTNEKIILEKYKEFSRKFVIINERIRDFMKIMKEVDEKKAEFIINNTPLCNLKAEYVIGWITYENNGFSAKFPYKGEEYEKSDGGHDILGVIGYNQNRGPAEYIIPAANPEEVDNLPEEGFEWEWSEEMLDKYITFCNNLIYELNNINLQISKLVKVSELEKKYEQLFGE